MEQHNTDKAGEIPGPSEPNRDAGQGEQDRPGRTGDAPVRGQSTPASDEPKVPPASETWVEGQPTSDADYGGGEKTTE